MSTKTLDEFIDHVTGHAMLLVQANERDRAKRILAIHVAFRSFFGADHGHAARVSALHSEFTELQDRRIEIRKSIDWGEEDRWIESAERKLAAQLADYVDALADALREGWGGDLGVRVRVETHEDMLDIAAGLVDDAPIAACVVAGAVLENHLKKLAAAQRCRSPRAGRRRGSPGPSRRSNRRT